MILETGRPKDCSDRISAELLAYDFLEKLGTPFDRVDHAPAMTMEICADISKVLGASICKNLFLCNRQQTDFYLLMMPDDKPFKTKNLTKELGCSRLSFASAEQMEAFLGVTPGSVSVLGLLNDGENKVTLVIDEDILKAEYFGCHPLINTSSLKIKTKDLMEKIIPALENNFKTVVLLAE
ncbi:MAG: prolyl-tRNA synthetase associated domain-containing protein [Elusimicrobiaceae bacterium]|nr:prolyl-tRNA synthetase associated domain-containing protein [Elusimicrobiaceae bacterium]